MSGKVLYRDVIPYEVPSSLSALRGPASGPLELPISIHWGPQAEYNLDVNSERVFAYQQIVREGSRPDQEKLLNVELLHQVWKQLHLPVRCRRLWEEHFPCLLHPERTRDG